MQKQRGTTLIGFIVGVVVGLAAALAVAVYVNHVPVPFMTKGQSRSSDQDEAEAKKNKDWDPNAPLYGKNPAKTAPAPAATPAEAKDAKAADAKAAAKPEDKKELKPAVTADPIGDMVKAKAAVSAVGGEADAGAYFVQVGSFGKLEDAEAHRAKLSLSGIESKISQREVSGKMAYRVRVGPFAKKEDGDKAKEKLEKAGLETALVHVQ